MKPCQKKKRRVNNFDDWNKHLSPPFVLYADIEALLIPPPTPADDVQKIKVLQTHLPIAVGSYLISHKQLTSYPQRREVIFQTGTGCVQEFCKYLDELVNDLYQHCKKHCKKPQNRTAVEENKFKAATNCEYCKVQFTEEIPKVHHHCHISGDMLAVLCQRCNTRIRQPITTLPILFHNLKNYDMHALCIEGFANMPKWKLKPIAQKRNGTSPCKPMLKLTLTLPEIPYILLYVLLILSSFLHAH